MKFSKNALFQLLMVLLLALILSACGGNDNGDTDGKGDGDEQVLNMPLGSEPAELHPGQISENLSVDVLTQTFEGLTRIGQDGEAENAMASEIDISDDKLVYTFTIREDANWSNGDPVTADDFEYAWKHTLDPDNPHTPKVGRLYSVKNAIQAKAGDVSLDEVGVEAVDDKTLVVELEHPVEYFLRVTANPVLFPIHKGISEENPDWFLDAGEDYVSNGPFKLTEWDHQSKIVMEKNEHYWDKDTVQLDRINFFIVEDNSTAFNMYQSGDLDYAGDPTGTLPLEAVDSLNSEGTLNSDDKAGVYYYLFNVEKEPFNNANIRKAFTLAVNRGEITSNIIKGGETPAKSLVPPAVWPENEEGYFQDGDVDEAKAYLEKGLEELGYDDVSELPPIAIQYNTSESHATVAQAIQDMWKKNLGIDVNLDNMEFAVHLDEMAEGNYQIGRLGQSAEVSDPLFILEAYRENSGYNYTNWSNDEFIDLLEQAKLSIDPDERYEILRDAEELIMDEMPILPIYIYKTVYTHRDYVKDVHVSDLGFIQLKWAYISEE